MPTNSTTSVSSERRPFRLYDLPRDVLFYLIQPLPQSTAVCLALTCHHFFDTVLAGRNERSLRTVCPRLIPDPYFPSLTVCNSEYAVILDHLRSFFSRTHWQCPSCRWIYISRSRWKCVSCRLRRRSSQPLQ